MEKTIRYRANVSSSTKGVLTFDCTVETDTLEETVRESDKLVAALKERYPLATEGK